MTDWRRCKIYILNEKDFIRSVLVAKEKPDDISFMYLVVLIAKYYYPDCETEKILLDILKRKVSSFNLSWYQEYKYHKKFENICKSLFNGTTSPEFKELEYIPIYENELKVVNSLDTDRKKKLMFTFFAVARYMDCDGWINKKTSKDISEVFKLANVNMTSDKRYELLHELYEDGYINFAKRIDNLNIQVNLDSFGEIVYRVKDFKNLGNQYIGNFKSGYRQCEVCGTPIKKSKNIKKYCWRCAKEMKNMQDKISKRNQRNYQVSENDNVQ